MPQLRNIRHERFIRQYLICGNGAEAYRRVYPNAKAVNTAKSNACHILSRPKTQRRIREIIRMTMKRSDITIEKVLTDYQEALDMARGQGKPGDIVSAATAQAKIVGHMRERVETGQPGDFDNYEDISAILEKVAAEAGPEAALAVANAFKLNIPQANESDIKQAQALLDTPSPSGSVN